MKKAPRRVPFLFPGIGPCGYNIAMHAFSYRWMTDTDVPAVEALARRIWHVHYPSIITVEQIEFMLAKSYAPDSLRQQMADGQRFLLALQDEAIVGFVSVGPLASITDTILRGSEVDNHSYFLHKFYIAPEMHRQGVGGGMFGELLRQIPHITRLRLQVARANVNSWKFYQKHGFVIEREADFAIGDGYAMLDYVMEKRIVQNAV